MSRVSQDDPKSWDDQLREAGSAANGVEGRAKELLFELIARAEAERLHKEMTNPPPVATFSGDVLEMAKKYKDKPFDYVIPNMFARQERFILTGHEGEGKSSNMLQMAVKGAIGLAPYSDREIPAFRSLFIDLENGPETMSDSLGRCLEMAGDKLKPGMFEMECFISGLDLSSTRACRVLYEAVGDYKPDVLFFGPLCNASTEARESDSAALAIVTAMNHIRESFNCAVFLEQHTSKKTDENTKQRSKDSYGAGRLNLWTEFGRFYGPATKDTDSNKYVLEQWRKDRHRNRGKAEGMGWPDFLYWNEEGWPLTDTPPSGGSLPSAKSTTSSTKVVERSADLIKAYAAEHPTMSQAAIGEVFGVTQGYVSGVLKPKIKL